jgi:ribosomal protein S18 acetylase RimI-like enzyme
MSTLRLPTHFDPEISHQLERLAARAWPADEVEEVEGWLLRRTAGVDRRRSNSLLPAPDPGHAARTADLALATAEELGFAPVVQVSPAEAHLRLDKTLDARGMAHASPSLVLASAPHRSPAAADAWRVLADSPRPAPSASDAERLLSEPASTATATSDVGRLLPDPGSPAAAACHAGRLPSGPARPAAEANGGSGEFSARPRPAAAAGRAARMLGGGVRSAGEADSASRVLSARASPAERGDVSIVLSALTVEWVDAWAAVSGIDGTRQTAELVLSQLGDRARFAVAFGGVSQMPVAVAVGVVEEQWLGLFSLATAPAARRAGIASSLVDELERWAATRGATRTYLQVEASNTAALTFYAARGFHIAHSYHYRSA